MACTPPYDEPFVALNVVRFVPYKYPPTPGVLIRLPLNVMLTLFELRTLLAFIFIFPFNISGLVRSLTTAGSPAAPAIVRLFNGIFASRK